MHDFSAILACDSVKILFLQDHFDQILKFGLFLQKYLTFENNICQNRRFWVRIFVFLSPTNVISSSLSQILNNRTSSAISPGGIKSVIYGKAVISYILAILKFSGLYGQLGFRFIHHKVNCVALEILKKRHFAGWPHFAHVLFPLF